MSDEEQKMWEHVYKYIETCAPIHWVNWISKCENPEEKQFAVSVLFKDGCLRDLTNETVKQEVIAAMHQCPSVLKFAIESLANEME